MTAYKAYNQAYKAQKRLPELEHFIMQDAQWSYDYSRNVIKGRWLEAEPYIMQCYDCIYLYARDVIKGRWLEAEELISQSGWSSYYVNRFFDEPVVTKDRVDIIQWDRKKLPGYFAPASLFEPKTSLLDMVIE